jgi:hypothetical protein
MLGRILAKLATVDRLDPDEALESRSPKLLLVPPIELELVLGIRFLD